jgi:hypothetical protein
VDPQVRSHCQQYEQYQKCNAAPDGENLEDAKSAAGQFANRYRIENKSNAPTIQGTTCVILVAITCDSLMMKERCAAL